MAYVQAIITLNNFNQLSQKILNNYINKFSTARNPERYRTHFYQCGRHLEDYKL